ncbi:MAG: YcjF family protein [Burkholderiales bacterium]
MKSVRGNSSKTTISSNPLDSLKGEIQEETIKNADAKPVINPEQRLGAKRPSSIKVKKEVTSRSKQIKNEGSRNMSEIGAEEIIDIEVTEDISNEESIEFAPVSREKAMGVVKNWATLAAGGGLVPVTGADLAVITGLHLKMVHSLCRLYGVQFKKEAALASISSILGGVGSVGLANVAKMSIAASVAKSVPLVGQLSTVFISPGVAYASAYAVGKVFVRHFEDHGTLFSVDMKATKKTLKGRFKTTKENMAKLFRNGIAIKDDPVSSD